MYLWLHLLRITQCKPGQICWPGFNDKLSKLTGMSLYTLSKNDILPSIKLPAALNIEECSNIDLLAQLGTTTVDDVIKRMANDHTAFVAYMNNEPAAFGWMARGKARIGELNHEMILPIGNRYLWNFRTMEAFRGRGIYPALLQYIIRFESKKTDRFWIIHAPENQSSLNPIKKAGFQYAGRLYCDKTGSVRIEHTATSSTYKKLLREMDIRLSEEEPASCWNCSSPYLKKRQPECCCSSSERACNGHIQPAMVA